MFDRLSFAVACLGLGACVWAQPAPDSPSFWLNRAQDESINLSDPGEKAGVLTSLAFDFSAAGDAAKAQAAAQGAWDAAGRISDPQGRFNAFLGLAGFNDQAGDGQKRDAAIAAAQSAQELMPPGGAKEAADGQLRQLRDLVTGWEAASRSIQAIADPAQRVAALTGLADSYAQEDRHHADFEAALAQAATDARDVKDPSQKGMLQASIVQTQARDGDLDAAARGAAAIVDPGGQGAAYGALADAYAKAGRKADALAAVEAMVKAAGDSPDDHRAAIWLSIARTRQSLGDTAGAKEAVDAAIHAADHLESADRADALAGAARLLADLGDATTAAVAAEDAAGAAEKVTDPQDAAEVNMTVAAAEARCGLAEQARQSIATARQASANIPADKRGPAGAAVTPPAAAYLDVIGAAAAAGDFPAGLAIAADVNDPHLKHDAALAVAGAEINLAQYQAAEDTVAKEGSQDSEAAVCGMISASLARTRGPDQALRWIARLSNPSDKVAACLAVAEVQMSKTGSSTRP